MTDYKITNGIVIAQGELAEALFNYLNERGWEAASLQVTRDSRGNMAAVVAGTSYDGEVTTVDMPRSMHLPLIGVRLAMRIPDTDQVFETLTMSVNHSGNVQVSITYDTEEGAEKPNWVMHKP